MRSRCRTTPECSGGRRTARWQRFTFRSLRAGELFERLTIFKPPVVTEAVMIGLWVLYVVATLMLMAVGVRLGLRAKKG